MSSSNNPATAGTSTGDKGFSAAVAAFAIWGLLPLYLKLLSGVPVMQIMSHRIVWCCLLVLGWLAVRGELGSITRALRSPATLKRLALTTALISINWAVYVWAVGNAHVVESSLGYFINPLVSVLLGVFLLKEKLNPRQWTAVGVAALGVLWLSVQVGHPPWIALVLAVSFGLYGFVRKTVAVESVAGLAVETALIFPFAAGWLIWEAVQGQAAFLHKGAAMDGLLIASGIVTAVPLVLFAYGVRRVPLSTVGLLQYMAPSLQLIVAIVFFHEPFTQVQLIGFSFIWAALAIYAVDGLLRNRTPRPPLVASAEVS